MCAGEDPTPTKLRARLIHYNRSWEQGKVQWLAADQTALSTLIPGARCGIFEVTSNADFDVTFCQAFGAPPVILLTAQGNDNHSTACMLPSKPPSSTGFTARLITSAGGWDHGKVHWMAIPAPF
jgi:hypothetical protein